MTQTTTPREQQQEAGAPSSGKGMPDKTPRDGRSRPGEAVTPKDSSDEASLELPHERDQAKDMTSARPDPRVKQGGKDEQDGLKDTTKGAEMDRTYDKLKK